MDQPANTAWSVGEHEQISYWRRVTRSDAASQSVGGPGMQAAATEWVAEWGRAIRYRCTCVSARVIWSVYNQWTLDCLIRSPAWSGRLWDGRHTAFDLQKDARHTWRRRGGGGGGTAAVRGEGGKF